MGEIVQVVTRKRSQFSGELKRQGSQWMVYPDCRELREPIIVRAPQAKNAKEGDKVVVELTLWPDGDMLAEGVIIRVLGEAGRPDVETQAVIAACQARKAGTRAVFQVESLAAGGAAGRSRSRLSARGRIGGALASA